MGMNILVTGGAGYIGSVLVPELLGAGYRVTVLDNFLYRQNSLASVCHNESLSIVNGDIRSSATVDPLLKEADIIIPLAAMVGAPLCAKDPVAAASVNKEGTLAMFRKLSRQQWVLMPTTNSAYGTGAGQMYCDERSPLQPLSLYARDKVEVEKVLMEHENAISFRLATVFGMSPRMRIDLLVNDFVYRAVNDRFVVLFEAHFKRNYIHVRDVVRAFLHACDRFDRMRGEIYNVGLSDANLSKLELCHAIARQVPGFVIKEAEVGEDPDKRNYIVSNAKIEATGFRPCHSLDLGVRELIKGYAMIKNRIYGNV